MNYYSDDDTEAEVGNRVNEPPDYEWLDAESVLENIHNWNMSLTGEPPNESGDLNAGVKSDARRNSAGYLDLARDLRGAEQRELDGFLATNRDLREAKKLELATKRGELDGFFNASRDLREAKKLELATKRGELDGFFNASRDLRDAEKLKLDARKRELGSYLDLARDMRDADKRELDGFLAANRDRRDNEKSDSDVNRVNVELLKQLEAMRLASEKDRREADRAEYYVDYERGLGAINYHQRKTDLEKSRYQLDAIINQNYTESNRKAYFEFDKTAHGTRFTTSNLKCDPEIKREFMAAWNSTFSDSPDWQLTLQKLLELSTKAVANTTTFKHYLDKLKRVMPDRERVARMTDRRNVFAFQTGPKFSYTFRPISAAVANYDHSEDYREIPRGIIYVDEETSDFFVADMLEFLNTVLRFPAGSVYPTRFDRVGLSTPNGNVVILDWREALEYGFYRFVTGTGGFHKRTISLTENTELENVYLHTIRFDATTDRGDSNKLIRLPGKETIRKIIGDNVGGLLTHASYIRAVVQSVEEYATEISLLKTKANNRFNALSAIDVLVTYLRYMVAQEKVSPRGTDFREVVRKLKSACPKLPSEYMDSYAVISDDDQFLIFAAREIITELGE